MYILRYLLRRVFVAIPTLLASSLLVFFLTFAVTDPLASMREHHPRPPQYIFQQEGERLMLDKPLFVRYLLWMKGLILHHNGGQSINRGYDILSQLGHSYFVSLRLVLVSTVISAILASVLGVYLALRNESLVDKVLHLFSYALYAIPLFYIAVMLKTLFINLNDYLGLNLIKTIGDSTPGLTGSPLALLGDQISHMVIPVIALTLTSVASWNLYQRNAAISIIEQDYVRFAVANGIPFRKIFFKFIVRNSIAPFITIVGMDFAALMSGAIIAELVFNWNGMGLFYLNSVRNNDVYSITCWLLLAGATVIVVNLLLDLLYSLLDPRVRRG
jgi:peptide/nickel transport system permease protein